MSYREGNNPSLLVFHCPKWTSHRQGIRKKAAGKWDDLRDGAVETGCIMGRNSFAARDTSPWVTSGHQVWWPQIRQENRSVFSTSMAFETSGLIDASVSLDAVEPFFKWNVLKWLFSWCWKVLPVSWFLKSASTHSWVSNKTASGRLSGRVHGYTSLWYPCSSRNSGYPFPLCDISRSYKWGNKVWTVQAWQIVLSVKGFELFNSITAWIVNLLDGFDVPEITLVLWGIAHRIWPNMWLTFEIWVEQGCLYILHQCQFAMICSSKLQRVRRCGFPYSLPL